MASSGLKVKNLFCVLLMVLAGISAPSRAQIAGKAVSLKGTDFFRTTLWSPQLFDNTESFTFEFWFNAISPGVLVGEADTANTAIMDHAFAEIFAGGILKAGAPNLPTITVGTITFGTWNHLTIAYDGVGQTFKAYLNGVLAGSATGNRRSPADMGREAVYPFGRGGPANLGGGNWYSGQFDEVRIWRIAVTPGYVAENWNTVLTSDLPGLMAVWHFDTTSGSQSPDSRAVGNNPALYVPVDQATPLVTSTAPLVGPSPSVTTKTAIVTDQTSVLRGSANPLGHSSSVFFEWGLTAAYGNSTPSREIGNGSVEITFSESIEGLAPGTYHFRAVVTFGGSTVRGSDLTFTIAGPEIMTGQAVVAGGQATLNATANPHSLASSAFFEWGTTVQYGNETPVRSIGSGTANVSFSEAVENLPPGTYHFRAVLTFAGGRVDGVDRTFVISPPSATTFDAIVFGNSVQLRGSVNPQAIAARAYFMWGPNASYGNSTPLQDVGSGTSDVIFRETLTNLAPGEYHVVAILTNATREFRGLDSVFTIPTAAGSAARLKGNDYLRTTIWSHQIFDDEDFTFELWFNASSPGVLINEPDTANTSIWDYSFAEVMPGGIIKAGVPGVPTITVGTVSFNSWHHLALVYDGTKKLLSAYLDGRPAGESAGDRNTPKEAGRTSIYCFGRGGPANLGGGNFLSGLIDEVRIWRRPLSAAEIASQFDKILTSTDPSLFANWHLDEVDGSGYLSPDASGKNNTAWYVPQALLPLAASTAPVGPDLRPTIAAHSARAVAPHIVELQGSVNAFATNTTVYFEYQRNGLVTRTPLRDIGFGNAPIQLSEFVSVPDLYVDYTYRLYVSNALGSVISSEGSFMSVGWSGYSFVLDGNNDYIRTENSQNAFFPDKNITVELWFKPSKAGVIALESAFSPSYDRAIIEVLPSGNIQAGFNGLTPISLGDVNFNQWSHVAIRYNASSQTMEGFLNGKKSQSRTGVRTTPAERGVQGHFGFGRATITKLGTGEHFGGEIDEIRVWNVARSDLDIGAGRFNILAGSESGLVLYWQGNPVADQLIFDYGSLTNIGRFVGAGAAISDAPLTYGVRRTGGAEVETQFVVQGGASYRLESSLNLLDWTPVLTNTSPASGYVRHIQPIRAEEGPLFYRVKPQ